MVSPSCHHCNLPIPPGVKIEIVAAGENLSFCCHGCAGAYRIISGAGLGEFYRRREWDEAGLPADAFATRYREEDLAPYVEPHEGSCRFTFLVEGIRCATCVWLNERMLGELPGVIEARLNYGTHRARVDFDPEQTSPLQLFETISRLGYTPRPYTRSSLAESRKREWHDLLIRFGTAFFLSMQLMGYSLALYAGFFQGIDPQTRQIIQYFAAGVTTPVVFYSGWPFLRGAFRSLRNRVADMDLLVALGVLAAYGASLQALVRGGEVYFDTAAMIITFLLAGRLFENSAKHRAATGIDQLLQLAPQSAQLLGVSGSETVQASQLVPGDHILIRAGERFPVDGQILTGASDLDLSAATGEPLPVSCVSGDNVLSGTLNLTATLEVRVENAAQDSFISRVARLVEEAQARKAPIQRLADRVAALFVPLVLLLSLGTALFWWWLNDPTTSPLLSAVAVLVVACPCALGLATPTAILVASGKAASLGILFRGGDTLERTGRCTFVAFDKTGTLTSGTPRVTACTSTELSDDQLLQFLATLEQQSSHPLAKGIVTAAHERALNLGPRPPVTTLPGFGLVVGSGEQRMLVGNGQLLARYGVVVPDHPSPPGTPVHLAKGQSWLGTAFLDDPLRGEAPATIKALSELGIASTLLTGDIAVRAHAIADQVDIQNVAAELSPADKIDRVTALQENGEVVLMAGDGINDAPALSAADVGCAMSGGTDIALDSSDLVLTRADLQRLVTAVRLARRTLTIIHQNLFWAFFYNLIALPLAAAGLLYPIHAAAAMALSSICVVSNSLRLKRFSSVRS